MFPRNTSWILMLFDTSMVIPFWWAQKYFRQDPYELFPLIFYIIQAIYLVIWLYSLDAYHVGPDRSRLNLFILVAIASGGFHLTQPFLCRSFDLDFSLSGIVFSYLFSMLYLVNCRLMLKWFKARSTSVRHVMIIGDGHEVEWSKEFFESIPDCRLCGYVSMKQDANLHPLTYLGNWQDLQRILIENRVDMICLSTMQLLPESMRTTLLHKKLQGFPIMSFAEFCQQWRGYIPLEYVDERWFLLAEGFVFNSSPIMRHLKRVLDIAFGLLGVVCLIPIALLIAIINLRYNPGQLFYSQMRVGLHGREFRMYKFRSMKMEVEKSSGVMWARQDDERATRWGQIMRKFHLDELPQVWNILIGEMSLVGPRPERREIISQIEKELPFYELRNFVKPGLTGWSQVNIYYADSVLSTKRKLQYDLYYIRYLSLIFDITIIAKTIRMILFSRGR